MAAAVGIASWYGPGQQGHCTAGGERFDQRVASAAVPRLPIPSTVRVTDLRTGRYVVVRANDRGPARRTHRVADLSRRAADDLGVRSRGTFTARVEYVGPAPQHGGWVKCSR